MSHSTLRQRYHNPYPEALEVLYTLPLPADGSVVGYAIRIGGRVIRGEVERRAEAREQYRQALLDGRTAGLLEQERSDTFTQHLGSLPSGEDAVVEIEVLHPLLFLAADEGCPPRWEYRFPTVVSVRYEGEPARVPDADKLDVERTGGDGTPVRMEATLLLGDGTAAELRPHAPACDVVIEEAEDVVRVSLREKVRMDRDLVLRWTATQEEVGVRLVEGSGLPGDDGRYGLITITPPRELRRAFARDLTLLIDASGSMSGIPLRRAVEVAERLLRSLDPEDRFEIFAFADEPLAPVEGPIEATAHGVKLGIESLHQLRAGGCTEMVRAIVEALKPLRGDSQRQVILLSDGYIGFEAEVIREVIERLQPGARLHAVGIGSAPNRSLIHGVARAGRGTETLVGEDQDVEDAAGRLLKATQRPVVCELSIGGNALLAAAPGRPGDVLAGLPRVLAIELKPEGGTLELRGRVPRSDEDWSSTLDVAPASEVAQESRSPLPIGALYGREAIEDCELELVLGAASEPVERQIEALGLRHRIASRMTSLVAFAETPSVDPRQPRRRERLPVELPADLSTEGVGLGPQRAKLRALHAMPARRQERPLGMFTAAPGAPYGMQRKRIGRSGPQTTVITDTRVLYHDRALLLVELEAPFDGFRLPGSRRARIEVDFDGGRSAHARIVVNKSSPAGPHSKGLTVRLALRLRHGAAWDSPRVKIRWGSGKGNKVILDVEIGSLR